MYGFFIHKSLYSVIRDENASKQCFGEGRSSECRVEGRVWMKTLLIISFFSSLHGRKLEDVQSAYITLPDLLSVGTFLVLLITLILQIKR